MLMPCFRRTVELTSNLRRFHQKSVPRGRRLTRLTVDDGDFGRHDVDDGLGLGVLKQLMMGESLKTDR